MPSHEVFISYHTASSAQTVHQICTALEGAGISCWYAPRNVEGDYAGAIVRAINNCKVFLIILNKSSNASEDVRNEINCAFERFRRHENIVLLPFRMDDCALSDEVFYYLGRIHMMDGSLPPQLQRVQELIDRICCILGKKTEINAMIPDEKSVPRAYSIVGSDVYADQKFVGRERELEKIRENLSGNENKLLLVGMGGIGKSEITKAYCARFRDAYDVILWVSFQGTLEATVINDFTFPVQGLERCNYPQDSDRDYFLRKLKILKEISNNRVLIVVDNFDVQEDPDMDVFCSGKYSVLFTTRYHGISAHLPELEIKPITQPEDLMKIFRSEYQRVDVNCDAVRELLNLLDGHPLSIRLVASMMQSRRINPEKMLQLMKDGTYQMRQSNAKAADMIFGRLRQVFRLSALEDNEMYLLKNLALLPLQGIPVETLYEWCDLDDFDIVDGLIQRSWIIHNPATDEVHLHPLVVELILEEVVQDPDCCSTLLETMKQKNSDIVFLKVKERRLLEGCFVSASQRLPVGHPMRWQMLWGRAQTLFETSAYKRAVTLLHGLETQTDVLADKLMVFNKLSHGYYLSGDPQETIVQAETGLSFIANKSMEDLLPLEGHWVRNLLLRLSEIYQYLGDYNRSEKYARESFLLSDRFYRTSVQSSKGWAAFHLAKVLFKRDAPGDKEECLELFQKAKGWFLEIDDELSSSYCLLLISQVYMRQKQFDEAFKDVRKAHAILSEYLNDGHIDFAKQRVMEGNIYRAQGLEAEALRCYAKAREITVQCDHEQYRKTVDQIVESKTIGYLT